MLTIYELLQRFPNWLSNLCKSSRAVPCPKMFTLSLSTECTPFETRWSMEFLTNIGILAELFESPSLLWALFKLLWESPSVPWMWHRLFVARSCFNSTFSCSITHPLSIYLHSTPHTDSHLHDPRPLLLCLRSWLVICGCLLVRLWTYRLDHRPRLSNFTR